MGEVLCGGKNDLGLDVVFAIHIGQILEIGGWDGVF